MLDFSDSHAFAYTNVRGLPVVATALYRAGGGEIRYQARSNPFPRILASALLLLYKVQ
jgi:hypothetical protein